jgi:hypothetical protein
VKLALGQRDDASGFPAVLGPHDRRPLAGQRQDRERTGGEEVLLGTAAVIALVRDGGRDRGLAVVPAIGRDAGAFTDAGMRAVGGDQEGR